MHKSSPLDTIMRHFSSFHNFTTCTCNTFHTTQEISHLATLDVSECVLNPTASVRGTCYFFQNLKPDYYSLLLQNWNYTLHCNPTYRAHVPFNTVKIYTYRNKIHFNIILNIYTLVLVIENFLSISYFSIYLIICLNVSYNICDQCKWWSSWLCNFLFSLYFIGRLSALRKRFN